MSIQYSGGTYVNSTFAAAAKADICSNLQTLLLNAGWTVVSGAGTTNLLMQTAAAPDSNNQGRVRFLDNGGNGIQVTLENVSGSAKQTAALAIGGTLKPNATYRLLATRYQFFCFPDAGTALSGQFVCAGILFVPVFLQGSLTEAMYMSSNCQSDSDAATTLGYASFRNSISPHRSNTPNPYSGNHATLVNGNLYEHNQSGGTFPADLATIVPLNSHCTNYGTNQAFPPAYRWHDLSLQISEVLVACGTSSPSDEAFLRGQLYDACYISDIFGQNATTSFPDAGTTHGFFCLCSSGGSSELVRGSLFVATS